ncbi:hypothetical protein VD0004_g7956 [Verticillium dahliae]|nr:hypothetical protein VD0004_g7956 [Verticillium dahliae]PNH67236.1 hypothetical protein VD0001_g7875 [Verticillium dahliae]
MVCRLGLKSALVHGKLNLGKAAHLGLSSFTARVLDILQEHILVGNEGQPCFNVVWMFFDAT